MPCGFNPGPNVALDVPGGNWRQLSPVRHLTVCLRNSQSGFGARLCPTDPPQPSLQIKQLRRHVPWARNFNHRRLLHSKDCLGSVEKNAVHSLFGVPSVFFDAVVILASEAGIQPLLSEAAAIDWVRDAFGHLKVIGFTAPAQALLDRAGVQADEGVIEIRENRSIPNYLKQAKLGRVWDREPKLRSPG